MMLKSVRGKLNSIIYGKPGITPLQALLIIAFFDVSMTVMFFTVRL
ncbi:hypothetical protein NRY70_06160 [Acidithiobacillus ferrooxidans]|nr:hypothetical protein [Acidithiobacillus ferrooxidans]